jgi:Arc/MetJ-type ribon-helix-helix transcriptional regulator
MKERISVTLDKEIINVLNSLIKDRKYRNRSHVVEYAIEQLNKLEEGKRKKGK